MTTKQTPIVIDIHIERTSPLKMPASIKDKIEKRHQSSDTAPTLEEINERLTKAQEIRREELARRAQNDINDRRMKVLKRREDQYKDTLEKYQRELVLKTKGADEKRQQVLLKKITVAHMESKKAEMAHKRKVEMESESKQKMEEKINEVHSMAEQKKKELDHRTKVKAMAENIKVSNIVETHKLKMTNEKEMLEMQIVKKLKLADMKREELLEKKVEIAHEMGQKRSPSKEDAPQAEWPFEH